MSFVRPEAQEALHQWRDTLVGLGIAAMGGLWLGSARGILAYVAATLVVLGLVLALAGLRRARFLRAGAGQGPGVVLTDEGEITYMGPLNGGSVAATELARLRFDPTMKPAHWVLEQPGQQPVAIPVNAEGTEALFDVFGALPGLDMQRLLSALSDPPPHPVVIWQREASAPPDRRLH